MALTTIDDRGLKTPIDLLDNEKIRFGTGNDLEIYHNGSNTFIENSTGLLFLRAKAGENSINCNPDGSVNLYYDSSKKAETTSSGFDVTGTLTTSILTTDGTVTFSSTSDNVNFTGASSNAVWIPGDNVFRFNDNTKAVFGTGNDLSIHHNGTDSIINQTTQNNLWIKHDSDAMAAFKADGAAELYYDNSKKLETTSTGITVTGLGTVTGGNLKITGDDEYNLKLRHSSASYDSNISQTSDGTLRYRYGSDEHIRIQEDGKTYLRNNAAPATALTSAPVQLILRNATDHNWDHNEHCGAIIFRKGLGAADNIVAAITGTHTRTGTGMSNEDGGIQIWTSPSANPTVPLCRWEFTHEGQLMSNGGYLVVNSEPDDRDEGQVLIWPRNISVDDDRIWIGTRDSTSDKYRFAVDGTGEVRSYSNHLLGVQIDDHITPTHFYNAADRLRYNVYRGTTDNANYRARISVGTASSDWDDYRVFYYTDSQDDAAVDYDQDQTISFSGSGRGNFKSHVWAGRVESDEASPNSVYALAERGFAAFADDSQDQTTCMARNVADASHVYYSEVNNEANFSVQADGTCQADDTDNLANADYAETFEWTDGNTSNQERRGMTVILDGEKVKLATDSDNKDDIIGVVSPNPAVLGDSASLGWHGRYKKDVYGTPIRKPQEWLVWKKEYTYVDGVKTLCAQPDPTNPKTLEPADVERVKVEDIEKFKAKNLIPDFAITNNIRYTSYAKDIDTTTYDPTKAYIPRKDRKEWDAIGMVGKLIVRRGQPVGTRWLLMKENIGTDTDGTVLDRYLVR